MALYDLRLTFDMEHDNLAIDWVGVDGTSILSLIFPLDITDLQVPLLNVWSHDAESEVVNHSTVFVRQRY